jgi:hypothetical protein
MLPPLFGDICSPECFKCRWIDDFGRLMRAEMSRRLAPWFRSSAVAMRMDGELQMMQRGSRSFMVLIPN